MKSLILAVMLVVCSLGVARANSVTAYITDGSTYANGTYVDRTNTTFSLSENPELYVSLANLAYNTEWSFWGPNGTVLYTNTTSGKNLSWLDTPDWSTITKTPGLWEVTAQYYVLGTGRPGSETSKSFCGSTTLPFTFAPEPISASLFLLGGAGLAIYRKRKQA
jgi:hypothetical protein